MAHESPSRHNYPLGKARLAWLIAGLWMISSTVIEWFRVDLLVKFVLEGRNYKLVSFWNLFKKKKKKEHYLQEKQFVPRGKT